MKADHCIVLSIFTFFLGILFGSIFLSGYLEITPEAFVPALTTLIAAFAGAWTAYSLQHQKDLRSEEKQNIVHANEVISAILDNLNLIDLYRRKVVDPFRLHPYRYLAILPTTFELKPNLEIDTTGLNFIWQKGNSQLPSKIIKAKFVFNVTLDLIKSRSDFHRNVIQVKFEEANFVQGGNIQLETVKVILGERDFQELIDLTNNMIISLDSAMQLLFEVASELHDEVKKIYPNEYVLVINKGVEPEQN
ncbi:MAG: hypothetical protein JAZ15_11090 [Candidatus Thiodiazotropha endolucinida]|nr:hypothetical protein [Candidatus Thiodiazotropha taylori]MCW4313563.1 hypothetical protein [Candidatus Thiodiazotropha taylori]